MTTVPVVHLTVAPMNGQSKRIVEACFGERFHRDTIDTNSKAARRRFINNAAAKLDLDPETLVYLDDDLVLHADAADEQVEEAATAVEQGEPIALPSSLRPEVDQSRIVRPERIITKSVSGLSVSVLNEIDGHIVGHSVTYLRHADGKREARALGTSLDIGESGHLFIHPQSAAPSAVANIGWSARSRDAWLSGAAASEPADMFARICRRIAEFVDLSSEFATEITATLGLWVILTYCYHAWPAVPYLYIGGPLGSGKTRLFEVLSRLVFRPLVSSNLTAAALFRTLNDRGGTVLLDEAERLRQRSDPQTSDLLSMLLAGYKRGGLAMRLEPVGDSFRPVTFDVYGPKALACIAGLPAALASRCIPVTMFRAPPGSDKPKRRIDGEPEVWQQLRDDLHGFTLENGSTWIELAQRTEICPSLSGRDYELWQPLLAIADWVESHGAHGLRELVEAYALTAIDGGTDDQLPEFDTALLRQLADMLRHGERPRASDILGQVRQSEPELFKRSTGRGVSACLKRYGIKTRKTGGDKRYTEECSIKLENVQRNYGVDLGVGA